MSDHALRLADALDAVTSPGPVSAELRRLHAENFARAAGQCIVKHGLASNDTGDQYCALQRRVYELENRNEELVAALRAFLTGYIEMANSGDCGFWNPEEDKMVIAARAALARAEGER